MQNELAAFFLFFFSIKPRFHARTWELASTTTHSHRWPCSIRGAALSFGTEIWVRIQSSWGAVLSRSDLEKVVHSKFHTERQAGRPWLDRNKNGGWRCSEGEYSFVNNVKWLQAVISPWMLHFATVLGPLCCWFEGRLHSKKLCFLQYPHPSVSWLFYLCEVDSAHFHGQSHHSFHSFLLSILSFERVFCADSIPRNVNITQKSSWVQEMLILSPELTFCVLLLLRVEIKI